MSSESLMESLGINYARKNSESKVNKYLPVNNYCIEPNERDLIDINSLDNEANTGRYHSYQGELEIMRSDMERLTKETNTLLVKERQVHTHKEHYMQIVMKKDQNVTLLPEEEDILLQMSYDQLCDWAARSIKARTESQATKIAMMQKIDELEKRCEKLLTDTSTNMVIKREGKMYLRFTAADNNLIQPNKRPIEQVALAFVRTLTKCEKLTKMRLDPTLELLKEYRDNFSASDRNYKKFNVAITRIENNKNAISRYDLSQLIFDLLTPERQQEYLSAVKICMETPDMKKEMVKLASDRDRELAELKTKAKEDAKKLNVNNRNRGRGRTRGYSSYNNYSRGKSNNNRYNSNRGYRGKYRGQNRGQINRGYNNNYRGNQSQSSYFNGQGNNNQGQNYYNNNNYQNNHQENTSQNNNANNMPRGNSNNNHRGGRGNSRN